MNAGDTETTNAERSDAVENTTQGSVDFCKWMEGRAKAYERRRLHRQSIFYWSKLLKALTQTHNAEVADVTKLAAIHYRLGLNHQALKETTKSIYHLKYSIRLDASVPRYYEAFGKAFLRGGHLSVARAQFERAVRLDPNNSGYLRQYSWILMLEGKLAEARLYARKAVEQNPSEPKLKWNLARIYFESRMYCHALSVGKKLPKTADWIFKSEHLKKECEFHLDQTLEGQVMNSLKRGMRFDGKPFHLRHFRMAEQLWIEFSLTENPVRYRLVKPSDWAAALSLVSFNILSDQSSGEIMDEILQRFSTDSNQVWPVVKKLGQYMECRGLA